MAPLPDAALSARELQKALDPRVFPAASAIVDPGSYGDLFVKLQRAAQGAKGGTFLFYFAGHALRRGGDLLLAVRGSELEGAKGWVPWSDVRDMLKREGVAGGLVLLNVDQPAAGLPQLGGGVVAVMGSVRTYDPGSANANVRGYADALLAVLQRPAAEIESFLNDGTLDASGLHKYLTERSPPGASHSSFSMPARPPMVRDLAAPAVSMRSSALPSPPVSLAKPADPPAATPASATVSVTAPAPATVTAPAPAPAPEPELAAAAAPAPESAPALEPAPAPVSAPVSAPEPPSAAASEPTPAVEPLPVPPAIVVPAPPPPQLSRGAPTFAYALLAAAAIVAALLYAILRS
ncbi:MAG TPA: hypothetical protein VIF09_17290 [Polyangiaceae bacterium]